MLLSEVNNKKVLSLSSAKILGAVDGVAIDKNSQKIIGLTISENIGILALTDVFEIGDVISVINDDAISAHMPDYSYVLKATASVYNVVGNLLGSGIDVELNGRKKELRFSVDGTDYKAKTIISASDDIIIVNPTYRALYKQEKKPERPVFELPPPSIVNPNEVAPTNDYDYLIGRKVKSEVSDIGRSFVLMAGTLITDRIIQNARRAGKISELINKSY